ncbi:intercellular trafficking and secretion, partial [Dissophora globulifera]
MDNNDDVGYSSVAWDTYTPSNGHEEDLTQGENGHGHGHGRGIANLHSSNTLHSSLFATSDEEDDDDMADITAVSSSTILPAETSAWADEPLDNEVIDIHGGSGPNSATAGFGGNGDSNGHAHATNIYGQDDDPVESQASQQVYRSHAPGKAVKRDTVRDMSEMSLSVTAAAQLAKLVPMEITVTAAHREKEGSTDSFISYQINTKTDLKGFSEPSVSVRRRFQDFAWLHNVLNRDFPAAVLPPLPDKHRLRYVRGDRFSPEFVEKRRASLERFLKKIAVHPTLQRAECLRVFLDSRDWNSDLAQQNKKRQDEGRLETIGDVLLNAFAKIKKPDERFIAMRDEVDKLEENLQALEKLDQRILKRQEELEGDYREFGGSVAGLGNLETGITEPLHRFAHTVATYAKLLNDLSTREDAEFLSELHECLAYCNSVKSVLKLRDQKQLDFEELSEFLQQQISERGRLMSNGRLGGSATIGGFFQQKMDEIKGVDQERAKQEKLKRVEERIRDLEDAVEKSNDISERFSNETAKEFEIFQLQKSKDLRQCMLDYTAGRVEFFEKGEALWAQIIPVLEAIQVDDEYAVVTLKAPLKVIQEQTVLFAKIKIPEWIRIHEEHLKAKGPNDHYPANLITPETKPDLVKVKETVDVHPEIIHWRDIPLFKSLRSGRNIPLQPRLDSIKVYMLKEDASGDTLMFEYYGERTPGSEIGEKSVPIHYRQADNPNYGLWQARECQNHIEEAIGSIYPVHAVVGRKCLEVMPKNVSKGSATRAIAASLGVAMSSRSPSAMSSASVSAESLVPSSMKQQRQHQETSMSRCASTLLESAMLDGYTAATAAAAELTPIDFVFCMGDNRSDEDLFQFVNGLKLGDDAQQLLAQQLLVQQLLVQQLL